MKEKRDRMKYLRRKLKQGKASGEEKLELAGLERELGWAVSFFRGLPRT